MTRKREPTEPEAGDWIVYTRHERRSGSARALGGPWGYAALLDRGVDGWTAKNPGGEMFIMDREILRVCLSRGEAIDLTDRLNTTQRDYAAERDALKPKFEQRIAALLNT